MKIKFKIPEKGMANQIAKINDCDYVSYNGTIKPKETALRIVGLGFYILEGDLRKELEKCIDIKEVINIFLNSNLNLSGRGDLTKETLQDYFNSLI